MAGVNRVTLLGNLGTDPEVRRTTKQTPFCRFRLATSERHKDPDGQWVDRPEWHNVVAWGKLAEASAAALRKGRQVYIEGSLRTRAWQDPDGQARHATEVVASTIQFLGGKGTGSAGGEPGAESGAGILDVPGGDEADLGYDEDDLPL